MKKINYLICLLFVCAFFTGAANTQPNITVKANGKTVVFDQQPVIVNDRIMVPIRPVFEMFGARFFLPKDIINKPGDWVLIYLNGSVNSPIVELSMNDGTCRLGTSKENKDLIFGKSFKLDPKPVNINGRIMIGVKSIAQIIDGKVDFDGKTRVATIEKLDWQLASEKLPNANVEKITNKLSVAAYEAELFRLTNLERSKIGVAALNLQPKLVNASKYKSYEMTVIGYFNHVSPLSGDPSTIVKSFDYSPSGLAENILKTQGYYTPANMLNAWMNSEGHRKNILNPNYTFIGVGYYEEFNDGVLNASATQLFSYE